MSAEVHELDQERFKLAVRVLVPMSLKRFIATMEHGEAFGCFTDPTGYMAKIDDLQIDLAAARAIQKCVDELRRIYKDAPVVAALIGMTPAPDKEAKRCDCYDGVILNEEAEYSHDCPKCCPPTDKEAN